MNNKKEEKKWHEREWAKVLALLLFVFIFIWFLGIIVPGPGTSSSEKTITKESSVPATGTKEVPIPSTEATKEVVNDKLNNCFSQIDKGPGESYIQYQQDICRLSIAKESKNEKLCSDIKNENKKSECEDYFKELPFVQGTATTEDILDKCKCTYYCYGRIYDAECLYKNVRTPQQCQSFMGLHYDNYISPPAEKIYFGETELKICLKDLIIRQPDLSFCKEYPKIYSEVCADLEQERVKAENYNKSLTTVHVMTDNKDVWLWHTENGKATIEEWKKEGHNGFRIFLCTWDEEFQVCIDYNAIYDEGEQSGLECNRHIRTNKNLTENPEFLKKYPQVLEKKFC